MPPGSWAVRKPFRLGFGVLGSEARSLQLYVAVEARRSGLSHFHRFTHPTVTLPLIGLRSRVLTTYMELAMCLRKEYPKPYTLTPYLET